MKSISIWLLPAFLVISGMTHAYDSEMAAKIHENVTGKLDQATLKKGDCKITSAKLLEMMTKNEPVLLLDVRTTEEQKVVAFTHSSAVPLPMDRLFLKQSLDTLPTDRPIVVICHKGPRAAASAILLRSIGFENARFLKGGIVDMVTILTPKTAP